MPADRPVQPGDRVAVRDAFGEWHPAVAESGIVRKGVRFPLVRCTPLLRGDVVVPFPVEDVLVLEEAGPTVRTLRQAVDDPPQPSALIRCPFLAERAGQQVIVTCVLERTAVYEDGSGERHLAKLETFVPVGELTWIPPAPDAASERAKRGRLAAMRRRQAREGRKFAEVRQ